MIRKCGKCPEAARLLLSGLLLSALITVPAAADTYNGVISAAERAHINSLPVSDPAHAAGLEEAQIAGAANNIRDAFFVCPDGYERYFDAKGFFILDQLIPDRSAYVDIDGLRLDPKDNNINKTLMKYASHGKRAIAYDKSSHYMELWENGSCTHSYMVTSGAAEGDKERQGDYRTPVGFFYICDKKVSNELKGELYLNYPDIPHIRKGLEKGIIDKGTADALMRQNRNLQKPSGNTALGGAIEIHGNGAREDATRGCVGVSNEWIFDIYNTMQLGDRVLIVE